MNSRKFRSLFHILCLILCLVITGCACTNTSTATTTVVKSDFILLDELQNENRFQFKGFTWFMSETDFFAKSHLDEKTSILSLSDTTKQISDKQNQTYDVPHISMFPMFYFSDGILTRVELIASFSDVNIFSSCAKDLKTILDGWGQPIVGNTSFLDQIPPTDSQGIGGSTWWKGADNSRMTVLIVGHVKTSTENEYVIDIQLSPPG